ncbi:hypothetical protein GTA08_BOTSDO02414 [Neofusicoccum parvum]|uniref:Uncharacterized protein n=1 Tax=Neofusicoccum parvum TaxID=310453 RepID=A0ACB5RY17_9PEZI|nr:hypothetical protein GTA08_BOTSDO02414 [Neofusicoccum parvum]
MKFSTIASTFISMAVVASAVPTANVEVEIEARTDKTLGGASETCNANQVVSCCNTSDKTTNVGGLLGSLIGSVSLLSGSCTGVSVPILNILSSVSASSACGNSNTVKCCSGSKQTGLINLDLGLQCTDIL